MLENTNNFKYLKIYTFIFLLVGIDQLLKIWVKLNMHVYQKITLLPNILEFRFIENEGMAMGIKYGGEFGRVNLTCTRIIIVFISIFLIRFAVKNKIHKKLIIAFLFLFAGLIGNVLDNIFYGAFFSESIPFYYSPAYILPKIEPTNLFFGKVVDMLYIPFLQKLFLPTWLPFFGGKHINIFNYVFNIADLLSSIGLLLFLYNRNILLKTIYKIKNNFVK